MKRGWCPTLHKPMETGDGLLVRLHIRQGTLMAAHARTIAAIAARYGNGHLDLTARGNLQIRGVTQERYGALFAALAPLGLADEPRPPRAAPSPMPLLGFLPDDGSGTLGLGLPFGRMETPALAWLADTSERYGDGTIRLSAWRAVFLPGIAAAHADRLLREAEAMDFIMDAQDARRAIQACPGAPACRSAHGQTRSLAFAIAKACPGLVASGRTVHVSGCAKGCAWPRQADTVVTAQGGAYDLAFDARAGSAAAALTQVAVIDALMQWNNR